jgi:CIC family chloride channel protein
MVTARLGDASGRFAGLVVIAVATGVVTGAVSGVFRVLLTQAEELRRDVQQAAGSDPNVRWLAPIAVSFACVATARYIVRWVPEAAGSGVQRLEAEMRGEEGPARLAILPAKFVGGLLSLGSGMALGREGPTVQMGASVAGVIGRAGRLDDDDLRDLSAAAGGAGLGVAFGAPIGGMLFTLEEVSQRFRRRLVLITLVSVAVAVAVAQLLIGAGSDFTPRGIEAVSIGLLPIVAVLGALCGLLGVAYNRSIIATMDLMTRAPRLPPEITAGLVGVVVAVVGLLSPTTVGGGDSVTQPALAGSLSMTTLLILLLVRWLLGPLCYSVQTPGGLFAPLLAIGALLGGLVAGVGNAALPGTPLAASSLAVVGMSAFFTATVRAPLTGIVLIAEMTATATLMVPMALAGGAATLVCLVLRGDPIYDTLRRRTEAADQAAG